MSFHRRSDLVVKVVMMCPGWEGVRRGWEGGRHASGGGGVEEAYQGAADLEGRQVHMTCTELRTLCSHKQVLQSRESSTMEHLHL